MPDSDLKRTMQRNNRIVTAIVLAALAGIGVSVYFAGQREPATTLATPIQEAAFSSKHPKPLALPGLKPGATNCYVEDDLYIYVDGEAEEYLKFGFRRLEQYEYTLDTPDSPKIVVDKYDMVRRRNAFGIFEENHSAEDEDLAIGNGGSGSGNFVSFWKGPFYVRVTAQAESTSPQMTDAVRSAAKSVAALIDDSRGALEEFSAFPAGDLKSTSYSAQSAFGLGYLNNLFVGEYSKDETKFLLFFTRTADEESAGAIMQAHAEMLKAKGDLKIGSSEQGVAEIVGSEKYLGPMVFVQRGNIVVGERGLDEAAGRAAVMDLLGRVEKLASEDKQ